MKRPRNVNPKNRYKALPLDFPFTYELWVWEECVKEENKIDPIFNRDGFYFDRQTNQTWLEIKGKAWKYSDVYYFKYELAVSRGNNRMHPTVFDALSIVLKAGLGNRKLKEEYWLERDIRGTEKVRRDTRLYGIKAIKEAKEHLED